MNLLQRSFSQCCNYLFKNPTR